MAKRCRSCCTPTPVCGRIAVVVNGCNGKVVAGAPVKLFKKTVTSVAVTSGGSSYTSPPTVVFATTNGRGATATAVLTGGAVTSINLLTGGVYTSAPVISFTGGGGTGAAATATLGAQSLVETIATNKDLTSFTFVSHGTNYAAIPNVAVSGGGGTGAVVTANLSAVAISSATLDSGGGGYRSNPSAALTGSPGSGGSVSPRLTAGPVTGLRLLGGSLYTNGTGYAIHFSGGGGTGAAGTFDVIGRSVCNLALTNPGSGYSSAPSIDFTAGGGSNAGGIATFNAGTGTVTGVFVESGSGYTPGTGYALGFSGGVGGSGAAGTFDVDSFGSVVNLVLTSGGSGYTTNPSLSFPGAGSGTGAAATALLGPTSVGALLLIGAGSGYTSAPAVTIGAPESGTTATGHVTLAAQNVASLTLVNGGRNFTSAPSVTIDPPGGGGTTATVTASIATGEESVFYLTEIGDYVISVDGSANAAWWSSTPITRTPSITSCSTLSSQTITLVPVSGYSCKCVQCRDPLPDTCTVTDANGTHTATFSGLGGWQMCYTLGGRTVYTQDTDGTCDLPTSTGTVAMGHGVTCPTTGTGIFGVGENYTGCDEAHLLAGTCVGDVVTYGGTGGITSAGSGSGSGGGAPNNCNGSVSWSYTSHSLTGGTIAVSFP